METDFSKSSQEIMNKNSENYAQINFSQVCNNLKENIVDKNGTVLISTNADNYKEAASDVTNSNINENNYSILEDASDSGVNCLDSESSEIFVGSFSSQNEFELDNNPFCNKIDNHISNKKTPNKADLDILAKEQPLNENKKGENEIGKNEELARINNAANNNINTDTGNIKYRNKTKNSTKAPKKRVSFHEDILKNTRTDNIHIEHGFITYKNSRKIDVPGRHSWCFNVDSNRSSCDEELTCRCSGCEKQIRSLAYRNACSDVLDYGNANVYESLESFGLELTDSNTLDKEDTIFHSNSNPNLPSTVDLANIKHSSDSKKPHEYPKSSSCDCIGFCTTNSYFISKYCYFSEPSIEDPLQKPAYSKQKKSKYSCLKKSSQRSAFPVDENDVIKKMQRFNVHELKILDKSKMILGTFKNMFSTDLPERGIPEGLENVHSVCEYARESETVDRKPSGNSAATRLKKLSKSLDGDKHNNGNMTGCQNKFIHNVDEQLRKKKITQDPIVTDDNLTCQSIEKVDACILENFVNEKENINIAVKEESAQKCAKQNYRNKYIINCVSTVFEHTGIPVTDEVKIDKSPKTTTTVEADKKFMDMKPLSNVFANIFKSIKESVVSPAPIQKQNKSPQISIMTDATHNEVNKKILKENSELSENNSVIDLVPKDNTLKTIIKNDDLNSFIINKKCLSNSLLQNVNSDNYKLVEDSESTPTKVKLGIKKKSNLHFNDKNAMMNPDLFDCFRHDLENLNPIFFNGENDNLLKVNQKNINGGCMDVVTPYYLNKIKKMAHPTIPNSVNVSINGLLKASQSALINRFLHDVSKNKIIETSIRNNMIFARKMRQYSTFGESLYIKGIKTLNYDLIEDLNAKIESEMSCSNFNFDDLVITNKNDVSKRLFDISRFQLGIGEVPAEIFDGSCQHLLNDKNESIMKVFKLYAGYSKEGFMTPVLVFLTDKALYVRDLVENRLCNKYILKYSELDVILIGPYGNTVLLSNVSRDMQKVLLAGGPHTADEFVANLELCIRRGGFFLPAVGQLNLENFNSLQSFVRQNLFLSSSDSWVYYAVINSSTEAIVSKEQFSAPSIKGFLMYRHIQENSLSKKENWDIGFFLLKGGSLYMFSDIDQQIPKWLIELSECQGFRRSENADRPHCFELILQKGLLKLAAPDEHAVFEWLQAFNKVEKGFSDMHKKQKILGCTLIMTTNHLVTLRENFTSPLGFKSLKLEDQDQKLFNNVVMGKFKPNATNTEVNEKPIVSETSNSSKDSISNVSIKESNVIALKEAKSNNSFESENMNNFYAENTGIEILTCAFIKEITGVRIPLKFESWWCILEFSCQEAGETLNDLVIFFSSSSEMQRFLRVLERLWLAKNMDLFPLTILDEEDVISQQCTNVFINISRSWIPLLNAALSYPA
ncbi:uncharacterized protein LOC129607182 [Condylostylus longicornis]|uniref:uncharacterized protein LOC129607182 n=1 Tax=Condylostylus longicornis TaxID=2530218 RepID=UPI00244DBAAD|nr:uncharacterized protein LOC129607182 [Condylostylus longicornis]